MECSVSRNISVRGIFSDPFSTTKQSSSMTTAMNENLYDFMQVSKENGFEPEPD